MYKYVSFFKVKTICLVLFVLLTNKVLGQSKAQKAIAKLLQKQTIAWNNGELNNFMQGYLPTDSLMFIGKSGITYGYKNTLANYKKNYADTVAMGKLDFTIIKVNKLSKKYYFVVGKWHLTRSIGNLNGHFTLLFKRIKKQWQIIADHSS
jgi:hypothetical protein